jgi:hypothetical protein
MKAESSCTAKNDLAALPMSGVARWLGRGPMHVCLDRRVRIMGDPMPRC